MPIARIVLAIAVTLAIVFALNLVTVRTLLAAHPSRRGVIWIATAIGNAMWLLLPFVLSARTSAAVRLARALLAPPWFSWLIFTFLYSALAVLIAAAWFLLARRTNSFGSFAHRPSTVFLVVLAIGCVIGYYQALVPLRTERVRVAIRDLPRDLDGYRIALISDLHVGLFTRGSRLVRISSAVNEIAPDVLAISGDMIDDDPYFVPKLLRGLAGIKPATPIVAVLGNHEIYGDPHSVIRALDGTRVQLLVNRGIRLIKGNGALWFAGISDYAADQRSRSRELRPDIAKALADAPLDDVRILLSHQPRAFPEARQYGIPLTLCGHTHGGQFGIRRLGWSLAGVFLPYHMGLYERHGAQLYVTTGTGYWVVPFRLGMTPEITSIELVRAPV